MTPETTQERKNRQGRECYHRNGERSREKKRSAMARSKETGTWGPYLMMRRYGITPEQFQSMRLAQENKCKLCGKVFDDSSHETKPHVDHSHVSGQVRSLLCACCNRGLGQFKDSPELLRAAASYLETYT